MKFVINTAIDPHFCAIFDDRDKLVKKKTWDFRPKDGVEVFEFLKKWKLAEMNLSFLGGVSGPGGFSSLRTAAGILNALGYAKKLPVHKVRADKLIAAFLSKVDEKCANDFVLNSFSDGVFCSKPDGSLVRVNVEDAAAQFEDRPVFVSLLPDDKQRYFKKKLKIESELQQDLTSVLLEVLKVTPAEDVFVPEYEWAAV